MQRKNFKKIGNKLAFNTASADPIFMILQELDEGYLYFLETTPFGPINFVHKHLVEEEKEELRSADSVDGSPKEEVVEETKEKKSTK